MRAAGHLDDLLSELLIDVFRMGVSLRRWASLSRFAWWAADEKLLEVVALIVVVAFFFESIADGEPEKLLLMTLKMVLQS